MPNSLSVNISVNSTIDNVRTTLSNNQNLTTTSSNFIAGTQTVGSAAWTALSTGSLADVILYSVANDSTLYTSSVVTIANTVAGANIQSVLIPNSQNVVPWSGSLTGIFAKVTSGWPAGTATPASASVQWIVQQS